MDEFYGITILGDRPLSGVGDFVECVVVVLAFVSPSKRSNPDFEEVATGLRVVPSDRSELIDTARDRAARLGDDVWALVHNIVNRRISLVEPRPIVIVSFVLQAIDDSRPIEPRAAIVSIFQIR